MKKKKMTFLVQNGTTLKIQLGDSRYLYVCPNCFHEVKTSDNYCSTCGFYLKGKNVSSYDELKERLK